VLLGLEHSEYFVGINLAENIARVGLSTALVLLGYGVVSLAVVILVLRVAASGVFLIVLRRKQVTLRLRPDPALCREFFRHMSVLGAIPIVNAVYTRLDIFLLSGLRGVAEVGVYSAAMRLVDVIRILPMAYTRAIYPLMARLHTGDSADRRRTLRVATAILLVIVLCAAIPCAALADTLIGWMYGAKFATAALTLRIVVWTLVPFSLALMLAQVLFAANLQVFDLRVNVIVTIVSAALNLVLIPAYGSVGAATTALASATLYAGMQYFYVASRLDNPNLLGLLGRLALAGAAAAAALILGVLARWSPFVVATIAWLGFAATFVLMSGAHGSERDEVHVFWGQLRASMIRRAGTSL
jgi:O-antigen/teichoic acid export membrane protein